MLIYTPLIVTFSRSLQFLNPLYRHHAPNPVSARPGRHARHERESRVYPEERQGR